MKIFPFNQHYNKWSDTEQTASQRASEHKGIIIREDRASYKVQQMADDKHLKSAAIGYSTQG